MNPLTDVVGRFHARDFDLCKAGGLVQFKFRTATGLLFVTAPLEQFVTTCRGPRDSNGIRLPEYAAPALKALPDLEAPIPEAPAVYRKHGRQVPEEKRAGYEAASQEFNAGLHPTKAAAARKHGVDYNAWINWHARHGMPTPTAGGPVLKPGGKIL